MPNSGAKRPNILKFMLPKAIEFSSPSREAQPPLPQMDEQVGGETTFSLDVPTNQLPTNYVSMRVKLDHKFLKTVQELFHDVEGLCIVEHGRDTNNEHFHICLPGSTDKSTIERFRKRVKDKFGGRGNGYCSLKGFDNGLRSFMFYCLHEGSTPRYEDAMWKSIVDDVKENGCYVKQKRVDVHMNTDGGYDRKDRNWVLTYSNLVVQAAKHRRIAKIQSDSLKVVVKDMIKTTKWRPTREMYKNGVCEAYEHDFQFAIGARAEPDMGWWRPKEF